MSDNDALADGLRWLALAIIAAALIVSGNGEWVFALFALMLLT